jgi:hypothetical protein
MSESQGQTTSARLDKLEKVERAILDRVDRVYDQVNRVEARLNVKITGLETKMDTRLDAIEENQRVMGQMLAEILARLPGKEKE